MRNLRIATGFFFAVATVTSAAYSETFTVTTDADTGVGSLREAITLANSNGEADEIVFAADYKIIVESPLPYITSMIAITGNGWNRSAIIGGNRIGESNGGRVFLVAPTGKLILDSVMLRNEDPTSDARGVSNDGEFVFRNSRAERKLNAYGGPGALYFDFEMQSVDESAGSATIGVTRWEGDEGEVSVNYGTSDGTAIEDIDYRESSGILTWSDGDEGTKNFGVEVIDNSDSDGDRTVNLALTDPTGGATIPSSSAVLVITDNDGGTGPCVQDLENGTVCLRNGRFEFIGEWTNFANPPVTQPLIWTPVEDINATGGFQNNPSGIQIVMRVADGCSLTGTWWVWLGGFTDAGWNITVRDTVTGEQRTFNKPVQGGVFPTTERDSINFICN
jgi:hypothetical protein